MIVHKMFFQFDDVIFLTLSAHSSEKQEKMLTHFKEMSDFIELQPKSKFRWKTPLQ